MALMAIHPGEHLSEELQTLEMSAAELARNLGVPTNRITQILNGQRAITGDTALRLAHFFGTTRNSGSTRRIFTNFVSPKRKLEKPSRVFLRCSNPIWFEPSPHSSQRNRAAEATVSDSPGG